MNPNDPQAVLDQLRQLEEARSPVQPETVESAKAWRKAITKSMGFLSNRAHSVVFVGAVGVGKSSLIGVAANLIVGSSPTDRTSLKNHSVLAIGSGRTTVCEVRVQLAREVDTEKVRLLLEPFAEEEMRREILLYAEDEWYRHHPEARSVDEEDAAPTAQEVQRAIRGMTGYAEYQENIADGQYRRRRTVRPLDAIVRGFETHQALAAHLLERANLPARTATTWCWDASTEANLGQLKARFEAVNMGNEPTATLPHRMTVVVPGALPRSRCNLDLTLVDTRGLDGPVESRGDIQQFLRDPRALLVLCASFKDAPGDTLRALLHSMAGDAQLRLAIPRTYLLLVDQGDADQVNGAGGDREAGQELKIEECHRVLEAMNSPATMAIARTQIVAFDALKDDPGHLVAAIDEGLSRLRTITEEELSNQIRDAQRFLDAAADELRPALRDRVDHEIRQTMAAHLPVSAPLRDPLTGLYQAIKETRYASVVYATCRRNGAYAGLDLYAAVETEASRAATAWLDNLISAVGARLDVLDADPSFARINDLIRLNKRRFLEAQIEVTQDYAKRVQSEVRVRLKDDTIWGVCRQEWGRGKGFKNEVLAQMEAWSRRQQGLTAHESTNAMTTIPLFAEVSRPAQPPSFTLYIRNLRALHWVNWSPEPLSILIGANGAGKTTLLQTLKLLHIAYERGLPEAVTQVLGGSNNLRRNGITEDEPVELGLTIGDARWRIRLVQREGSVDYFTDERLSVGEREVYSRDSMGAFLYGSERIEPTPQLGLRALMDRGVHEPAVRSIASFLWRLAVYHDPDLWHLRWQGSNTSEDRLLHSRGLNALAVLRRWHQDRSNRHRYQFVVDGLSIAFPNTVKEIDFQEAGNTIVARIYRPGAELPTPLAAEANGVLQLLILFCQVANAEDESLVAIDEPENSLHPYALRSFLRRTGQWARQHKLTVVLATHSTVLLDELSASPEQIFVMKPSELGAPIPTQLDRLCDRDWLEGFKIGDLYEQGEIGSNEDEC